MKNISLLELREFLLTLPDDHPINMTNGSRNDRPSCLMTQYGESIGLEFDHSCDVWGGYKWLSGDLPVAEITEHKSVFTLFRPWDCDLDGKENRRVVGFWKSRLKTL